MNQNGLVPTVRNLRLWKKEEEKKQGETQSKFEKREDSVADLDIYRILFFFSRRAIFGHSS